MRGLQKWAASGILSLGLSVLMPPQVAAAQGTGGGDTGGRATAGDDDGFNAGWLGLLGLAGLAGLLRRDRRTAT